MSYQEEAPKVAVVDRRKVTKPNHWRWLKVGLPALALSAAFATTAVAGGDSGWRAHDGASDEQREKFMEKRLSRMLEHVDATAQQETQIKAVFANHKAQMKASHQERKQLRDSMRLLMTAPTIDVAAVEGVRGKMVAQAEKSSRLLTEVAVQVGQVLTQAQRQQLAEHMAHKGGRRHGPGHGPGGFGF